MKKLLNRYAWHALLLGLLYSIAYLLFRRQPSSEQRSISEPSMPQTIPPAPVRSPAAPDVAPGPHRAKVRHRQGEHGRRVAETGAPGIWGALQQ